MMKKRLSVIIAFIAGTLFGVLLMVQIPSMLAAQRGEGMLPHDSMPTAYEKSPRMLDIAILGRGYFQFDARDGSIVYSRESSLYLNAENNLVGRDGLLLNPAITVPEDTERIGISEEGIVSARLRDENKIVQLGYIQLALFDDSSALQPSLQEGYFNESETSGAPMVCLPGQGGSGKLLQGYKLLPYAPAGHPSHLMTKP